MKQLTEKGKTAVRSVWLRERKVSVLFLAERGSHYGRSMTCNITLIMLTVGFGCMCMWQV